MKSYDKVIIDFFMNDPVRHGLLIDLCRELKSNPLTSRFEVIAILAGQDRQGLEILDRAGADFVFLIPAKDGIFHCAVDINTVIDTAQRPRDLLAIRCPLIGYDAERGIASCGAHRNRLILGRKKLADLCCEGKHTTCEFFLHQLLTF